MAGSKNRIVDDLVAKLHGALREFVMNLDRIVDENRDVKMNDIRRLRDLVHRRLTTSEDVADRKKLVELLGLFATDKAVIELIREDAEEWVRLLDAIKSHIAEGSEGLTDKEREEVAEINRLASKITAIMRK